MNCPIWGTPATEIDPGGGYDGVRITSTRAGGAYAITGSAIPQLKSVDHSKKKLLTTWLVDQRRAGISMPEVTTDFLATIKDKSPLRFSERINRVFKFIESNISKLGQRLSLDDRDPAQLYTFQAETECVDGRELIALLGIMEQMGFIELDRHSNGAHVKPPARGWQRIEELQSKAANSIQAFVAMWFHPTTEEAYRNGIAPAIIDSGYDPLRIDGKQHVNKIDDEIIAEIRRSRFIVADFTCEPEKVRGGVYFEAGFAMALGIPVIWTCNESSIHDLHFDTRQYNHIAWQSPDDLRRNLKSCIGAILGDGPRRMKQS